MNITGKVKSLIQALANSLGYEIRALSTDSEQQQRVIDLQTQLGEKDARLHDLAELPEQQSLALPPPVGEYTYYYPWGYHTYSPWWQAWFQEILSKVKGTTLVTEDRCYIIYSLCLNCVHLQGDFAECGVYRGGTVFLIAEAVKPVIGERQVHLFDTFTGMPDTAIQGIDEHRAGDFADTSLDSVKRYLSQFPFVLFHPGFIPDTFGEVRDKSFSFVHVDVDIYQSAHCCCDFFYQRMVAGGIMVFDDYGFPQCKGVRKAVDEFFMDKKETPVSLPTGQCLVIKR